LTAAVNIQGWIFHFQIAYKLNIISQ
jgi:hypothetical protein